MPSSAPPLSWATKQWYGLGQAAEGIKNHSFANFLLFYYTQALGLSGTMAGTAVFIALIFDAVSDPLTGVLSDRLHSRWGRRHPFMYAAALPLGVSFYLAFAPPAGLSDFELFLWLTITAILTRGSMTLYHVPHISLGAELSSDYAERTRVVQTRAIWSILGVIVCIGLAMDVYFVPTPEYPEGQLNPHVYPGMAAVFGAIMSIAIFASALGTHSRIPYLANPDAAATEHGVITSLLRDLRELLRLDSFRALFFGITLCFVAIGVANSLGLYLGTYFWKLSIDQMRTGMLFNAVGIFTGFVVWPAVATRIDKKPTFVLGFAIFLFFVSVPILAKVVGLYPAHESRFYIPLYNFVQIFWAFGVSATMVLGGSMMADVTDEDELVNHRRREGVFFGANSLSSKTSVGIGSLVAGATVDWVGLVQGMTPEQVTVGMQQRLGVAVGLSMLLLVGAGITFFSRYPISQARHAEIRAVLDRRAEDARETP